MSNPGLGKDAVIQVDGSDVGYAKGVTYRLTAEIVKDYKIGDDSPAILESGNKTYTVGIEKMFIDNTYADDVLNGTKVSIVIRPLGTGSGKPEITLSNVVLNSYELTITQDGVVLESVEGEAAGASHGTQA